VPSDIMTKESNASWWAYPGITIGVSNMKNAVLLGIVAVTFAALVGGILPAFARSIDPPQPGRVDYVVYNQTDGSIAAAGDCPAFLPPLTCIPGLKPGQSVLWITDNPVLVKAFFTDAKNAKMGNWHVNLQTQQLERSATTSSGPVTTPVLGTTSIQVMLPAMTLLGAALSTVHVRRRAHKQSS
jgi:hypothetical protein